MRKLVFIGLILLLVALPLVVACEDDNQEDISPPLTEEDHLQRGRELLNSYRDIDPNSDFEYEPPEHKYSADEAVAIVIDYLYDQAETYNARVIVMRATENYSATDFGKPDYVWNVGHFRLYEESKTVVPIGVDGNKLLLLIARYNDN